MVGTREDQGGSVTYEWTLDTTWGGGGVVTDEETFDVTHSCKRDSITL